MNAGLLDRITSGGLCVGCGLCEAISSDAKVQMELSPAGYLRPYVAQPLTHEEEGRIASVCPGIITNHQGATVRDGYDRLWGSVRALRVAHATDADVRYLGSSGGVLSALLLYLLAMGKVDYVVQTAGAVDQPLRNITQQSRNREDVLLATGSRYSPSAPLKEITRFLGQPGKFAFVGKPCDVVGLRNYAQVDSRVSERIPFMLSFMCAGTPSLCGTLALLQKLEVSPEDVTSIRYRGMGWPGLMSVTTQDGRCLRMAYDEAWGKLSRYLQFRCKICPDGVGEFADLTCADAWHLENGSPSFTERDGESLVISRTIEGEQLILDALAVGVIAAGALESDRLSYMQPYQAARKQAIFPRLLAMRMVGLPTPLYRNFRLGEAALRGGPKSAVTSFTGTLARLVLGTSFDVPELPLRRRFHRQSSPERSLARLCKQ